MKKEVKDLKSNKIIQEIRGLEQKKIKNVRYKPDRYKRKIQSIVFCKH